MRERRKERERGGMVFKYPPFLTAASTHHPFRCSLSLHMLGDCAQIDIQIYVTAM
jgi:hypothetical protein